MPWGFQVSPIWRYRSGLPVNIVEGVDLNGDNVLADIPARAYAYDGVGKPAKVIGECTTISVGASAAGRASKLGEGTRRAAGCQPGPGARPWG